MPKPNSQNSKLQNLIQMGFFTKFFSKEIFDFAARKKVIFPRSSFGLVVVLLAFVSCSQKPARVVDNSSKSYKKNYSKPARAKAKKENTAKIVERDLDEKPAKNSENFSARSDSKFNSGAEQKSEKKIVLKNNEEADSETKNAQTSEKIVEVEAGETLHGIARKYQISISDLAKANALESPYILKKGQRLKIPKSNYHLVQTGETLYGISRVYGMKIDQIIALNDLKKPYAVKVGDKLKVNESSNSAKTSETKIIASKHSETKEQEPVENEVVDKKFVPLAKVEEKSNRFSWPIKGKVVSGFGPKKGGLYNDGINISAKRGDEVKASEDGVVAYVGNELKGYGNLIIVKHSGGWITAYAHLEKSLVKRGEKVKKGEKIALVGASGNVKTPQLYFGLRKGRDAVNPQNHLK